jgi:hypothetical protein
MNAKLVKALGNALADAWRNGESDGMLYQWLVLEMRKDAQPKDAQQAT